VQEGSVRRKSNAHTIELNDREGSFHSMDDGVLLRKEHENTMQHLHTTKEGSFYSAYDTVASNNSFTQRLATLRVG
jgi:hypothetical protein